MFQLHLLITITYPNLPDESLKILPGSFLAAWVSTAAVLAAASNASPGQQPSRSQVDESDRPNPEGAQR